MKRGATIGYSVGIPIGVLALFILFLPEQEGLHASGPSNTGHELLKCEDCHRPAVGTFRQQIQANIFNWLGRRASPATFQYHAVSNSDCNSCHDRPNDNHPAHRFLEPRFSKARINIAPQKCISCHREHEGVRVTVEPTFCVHCHEKLVVKKDPLDISHWQLIAMENWSSCLTCHDFHGNHVMKAATTIKKAFKPKQIKNYFDGGTSPYPEQKYFAAKETLDD